MARVKRWGRDWRLELGYLDRISAAVEAGSRSVFREFAAWFIVLFRVASFQANMSVRLSEK